MDTVTVDAFSQKDASLMKDVLDEPLNGLAERSMLDGLGRAILS